ncbi:MAG TPA: glycosyltransferase family 2 protein [Planctomycetota bacterium]|nr:glycosyltransferase family 2 protein [Planctomycetota bacterium]
MTSPEGVRGGTPGTETQVRATVVVPTYNEADNVEPLVRRISAALPEVEIVFVDDASNDGTADRVREISARYPVRVVVRTEERGLSTAVLRGFQESRTDICVVIDADLSHPPEKIPELVKAVEDGAQVAVGSRYMPGGDIDEWPLFRRFASKAGTLLARPLTPVSDPMAGFFCLRRSMLQGVELKPRGFKILLEILSRCRVTKLAEIPIRFEDRAAGQSKFSPRERKEFLRQIWTLYTDLNAWPLRVAKFLVTGGTGSLLHLAILWTLHSKLGLLLQLSNAVAFTCAMTSNYSINRIWTFRARMAPVATSYVVYAVGAIGGWAVQSGILELLKTRIHYLLAAAAGIVVGTLFTFLTSQFVAFRKRG